MKIHPDSVKNLSSKGIYSITCLNGKRYIGSTKKSFLSRFKTHFDKLRSQNHQNQHLQSAWWAYGHEEFVFEILEVVEVGATNYEEREKAWIEYYDSTNREKGYNINSNPCIAPSHTKEVKEKIAKTLKEGYKSGRIPLNTGNWEKGKEPWNKGRKYNSTDHLKGVKKGTGRRSKALDKSGELLETPELDNQQPNSGSAESTEEVQRLIGE